MFKVSRLYMRNGIWSHYSHITTRHIILIKELFLVLKKVQYNKIRTSEDINRIHNVFLSITILSDFLLEEESCISLMIYISLSPRYWNNTIEEAVIKYFLCSWPNAWCIFVVPGCIKIMNQSLYLSELSRSMKVNVLKNYTYISNLLFTYKMIKRVVVVHLKNIHLIILLMNPDSLYIKLVTTLKHLRFIDKHYINWSRQTSNIAFPQHICCILTNCLTIYGAFLLIQICD
jgi:hypothetical protein